MLVHRHINNGSATSTFYYHSKIERQLHWHINNVNELAYAVALDTTYLYFKITQSLFL